MERQELVEEVLRLYVYVLDEIAVSTQKFDISTEPTSRTQFAGRIHSAKKIKAFIEDHFRPLV